MTVRKGDTKMGIKWGLLCAAVIMLPGQTWAGETYRPIPLQDLEALENLGDAARAIDDLSASFERNVAAKKTQCMKAFGNTEFCKCIGENSPVGVTFMGYVSITAGSKQDLKYDQLSAEDKELFDLTRAARDKCVQ